MIFVPFAPSSDPFSVPLIFVPFVPLTLGDGEKLGCTVRDGDGGEEDGDACVNANAAFSASRASRALIKLFASVSLNAVAVNVRVDDP